MTDTGTPIWKMRCESVDLLLATAFDERELENIIGRCASANNEVRCPRRFLPGVERVAHRAHALCHEEGFVARRIQKELDLRFDAMLRKVQSIDPRHLATVLLGVRPVAIPELPAMVWAISRDARPAVQHITREFLWRLRFQALRDLCEQRVEGSETALVDRDIAI